jgi:2-polyprenyl-6-hydroxyphenyl methylase/3-demethylubiquinone-9 3-methyltransferase
MEGAYTERVGGLQPSGPRRNTRPARPAGERSGRKKDRMVNTTSRASSIDDAEVERFGRMAARWWDPRGPMAPLHKLNPVRIGYIRDQVTAHFGRDQKRLDCLSGLRILDIGCGAGILSEPLTRLGAAMVGVDPAEENIAVARTHAEDEGLSIDYRATTAEAVAEAGETFDVVLAMEVVEHVVEVPDFVATCAGMVKPGGLMIAATLNRTLKSFALAIVGAEYILRWLPRGTHQWDKFVTPAELERAFEGAGLDVIGERGVIFNPLADRWQLSSDMDVNYMLVGRRS